ncbi:MAG: response regulator [Sedimentisphaerales bacterium]|jgi:two-component system response regulator TtrR|nr:response regulator [Sedimentisphaerales bacterium]HNY79544.1 response regulator [Sedimentisphaerales bacterium]HQA89831.1 response regulator [Sedimentisphaerales bacterium]HQN34767.1 response regulator [Sedimentisphaerales bacterium]
MKLQREDSPMENKTLDRIFFVDDEPSVRLVVRKTLERVGVSVTCFAGADDCLACLESTPCDLLITDVKMPGRDGIELLEAVKAKVPWLPVLVVTGFGDVPMAVKALKLGAADFIEKPLDREAFLKTVQSLLGQNHPPASGHDHALTKTELRILHLILEGKNNREIALALHRSPRTVEVHRSHVMRKMGATNIVELLRRAAIMGLFDMDGASAPGRADA